MSTIIIDGNGATLGRLSSFAAKSALKGEEIVVVNSDLVIISGNKSATQKDFDEKRSRFGHSQKGPKHHKSSDKIVKRTIRGMLPDHRVGRGRQAFKRIKCYIGVPKEFEDVDKIKLNKTKPMKYSRVKEFLN